MKQIIVFVFFLTTCIGFSQTKENRQTSLVEINSQKTKNNTVTAVTYQIDQKHYVYSGGDGPFVDAFSMNSKGVLNSVGTYELSHKKGPARGMVADRIQGSDYLFVGNKGGDAVEVFKIEKDGSLQRVFVVKDTAETHLGVVITLKVIHIKKSSYLFVGGLERETPGLSCFKIHADGKLTHVQSMKDTDEIHTDGIIGMYAHQIKGKTFLFTGGFQDNGISSFRVYANGRFKAINSISDNTVDRYLTGTYPVDGVTLGNHHYVVVGHRHHKYYKRATGWIKNTNFVYHGDGVSVFKVTNKGELVPHSVLVNNEQTKLAGQTRIEILKVNNDEAVVAIATRDDESIQLCTLNKDGILIPTGFLETGYPIYYGMASQKIGQDLFFLAGSVDNSVKNLFSYKVNVNEKESKTLETKVLRHVVNLKYIETATTEEIDNAVEGFKALQNKIPEILDFEWGINISKEGHSKGFTHCFFVTFKDEASRDIYLNHKDHLALVAKVGPLLADVLVMDYWTKISLKE
ncbi:Dabb family protein [Wenyingzhuangia aestuarii]|uniref:Dabb family protein n=1 Tax=Wenyingzhuangia aestuarii TaxID=1647582 RepID=UPI00143C6D7A|nr:Dabb family protein [Wenyingzhuangia aestuarii]NJB82525.1 6-phosphogluconolactonase (cycloisomerase 2 family) [Wenyingzhuangia aestuarii]